MTYRWELTDADEATAEALQQSLGIHPVLCRLLVQRGVTDFEQARLFFRPDLSQLHDPLLMSGMRTALDRLDQAIQEREHIVLYGDYDVDGTTAVALVHDFLSSRHEALSYYIPDRDKEGYGLSEAGIRHAAEKGAKLLIALDCGIKAVERVAEARALGIDVIIADHHLPGDTLPDAVAVLDPKQPGCTYPYKDLCGCGIGFKLIQGYVERHGLDTAELYAGLDLVAVSIAADIVPITGENRVLAHFGLRRLEENPRPGLAALMHQAGVQAALSIRDLVFGLAPCINAAGRMGHARDAVQMLLAREQNGARQSADHLQQRNNLRKEEDKETTRQALEQLDSWPDRDDCYSTVVYAPGWHKGVIGIVASRLIERYFRPTVVLTIQEGIAVGSARSVPGFDVYDALSECADLLDRFGGHRYAAGLSLKEAHLPAFRERFEAAVRSRIRPEQRIPRLAIDAELDLATVNERFYRILSQFEPFGPGNPSPLFSSRATPLSDAVRILKGEHLKLRVKALSSPDRDGQHGLEGIAFGQADAAPWCQNGQPLQLAYHLEENRWQGKVALQLQIKSILRETER